MYSLVPVFKKAIFSQMSRLGEGCDTLKNNGENKTIILRSGSSPEYGNINCLIESQSAKKLSFSVADNRKIELVFQERSVQWTILKRC
ncbi:hypothetical protein BLD44_000275 [Mastigocladus laminosus UU774]|nr:hypothetical protein B4U84_22130 [Westiellopsis prolifica IICB1]TFI55820.1 hypothetical protein BLD44_000275 [Mastigocladus laminosus UU774]